MKYQIRAIKVEREDSKVVGVASLVLEDVFAINQISIMQREDGTYFTSMPAIRTGGYGISGFPVYKDIAHPITAEFAKELSKHVLETFAEVKDKEPVMKVYENEKPFTFSVQMNPYEEAKNLRARGTITFSNSFLIRNVRIMEGQKGLYVQIPSYKTKELDENNNPVYKDYAHPVTAEFRDVLYETILGEYQGLKKMRNNKIGMMGIKKDIKKR